LGNLRSTTDPGSHTTTFDYTDSYSDNTNHNTQAFPTTITFPNTASGGGPTQSHIYKKEYYWPSAALFQATDENNQLTTYNYGALTGYAVRTVNYPDGGQTFYDYWPQSQAPTGAQMAVRRQIDSTPNNTTNDVVLVDGFGRTSRTERQNGGEPAGTYNMTDVCYNSSGQVFFAAYAYQANAFPNATKRCSPSTYAGDSFSYDGSGRNTSVTHSDGTSVNTTYSGRAVQVQDEGNGSGTRVTHVYQQDGLGRTVTSCELAGSIFGIPTMPTCGLDLAGNSTGVTTSYTYDPLGDVTQISQGALAPRRMTYDGLGHLLSENIPEASGNSTSYPTSYSYNSDGLLASRTRLSANQSASCLTPPPGTCTTSTTTYAYDELHRPWTVSHADTASENTPNIAKFYDYPFTGTLGGYNVGRMTFAYVEDKAFSTTYVVSYIAYDKMGRVSVDEQNFNDGSLWRGYNVNHTYNLLGLPATSTNGTSVTYTYTYNNVPRLTQMTSSASDATHPGTLFSAAHYNAGGELTSDTLGNGVNEIFNYDARWRPLSASATKNTTTLYSLGGPGTGNSMTYAPNSQLTADNDSVNGNWSYSYDALDRIAVANQSGGTSFTFDIDRNANRWHQNPVGQGAQLSFDNTTNHITNAGYAYDAAGNIINDGMHTYTYDAEYRITQVDGGATATYFYDAFGRRARRTVGGTAYEDAYDGVNMTAESRTGDGVWARGEIYGPIGHLATYINGTTYFSHKDWLGSERVRSDVNGNSAGTCTGNAYGDNYVCAPTDPSPIKYAGMEYDSESKLYHTWFRYYNPRLGLWMTPDPAGLAAARLGDPQTQNRYSFAINDPVNLVDPYGLAIIHLCVDWVAYFIISDGPQNGQIANVCAAWGWLEFPDQPIWDNNPDHGGNGGGDGRGSKIKKISINQDYCKFFAYKADIGNQQVARNDMDKMVFEQIKHWAIGEGIAGATEVGLAKLGLHVAAKLIPPYEVLDTAVLASNLWEVTQVGIAEQDAYTKLLEARLARCRTIYPDPTN
jgi:RHS repeat-associated protein